MVSSELLKALRDRTGLGLSACKKALEETQGDLDEAVTLLRKKGMLKAVEKAERAAQEGVVGAVTQGSRGLVLEVNTETDFVARNEAFLAFVDQMLGVAMENKCSTVEEFNALVDEKRLELIGKIGENIVFRRLTSLEVEKGVVVSYVHSAFSPKVGKIAVIVALSSTGNTEALNVLGKDLAMHIAAQHPMYTRSEEVPGDILAREKSIGMERAQASGKPEPIVQKMAEAYVQKYLETTVLLEQGFVKNPSQKVAIIVQEASKACGAPVEVVSFARFAVGEQL